MRLKLGMCGFTIAAARYYRQLPVVEVQQTFYDPPADSTLERWRRDAPPDFEFTMKAWQVITHRGTSGTYRRLKSEFSDQQRAQAGAFQQRFFAHIMHPAGVRLLWEPRGAWPDDTVRDLCVELDLIHVVDPFVRPSLTPALLYWRLHGNKSAYARYTDEELRQLRAWLDTSTASEAYVLFNNVPRVKDIERFRELQLEY